MDQDPIHKCFALLKAVIEDADTSRIPEAQFAVDRYVAVHTEPQRLFAIEQLDNQVASLWHGDANRLSVLSAISAHIGAWHKKLTKRN